MHLWGGSHDLKTPLETQNWLLEHRRKADLSLSRMETFMWDTASENYMLALWSYCENLPFLASDHLFAACVGEQTHKCAPRQCHTSSAWVSYADTSVCVQIHIMTHPHTITLHPREQCQSWFTIATNIQLDTFSTRPLWILHNYISEDVFCQCAR